tara:strand:+ start:15592 stop:16212 length:621 start_codon:yes stop_codon:yes gene_type:complete
MKSTCLIGKGPSAIHADEFMNDSDDVSVVNDAGIFTNRDVDYCFCTHNYYTTLRGTVHKIKNIVTPKKYLTPEWAKTGLGGMHLLDEIKDVNKIVYNEKINPTGDPSKLIEYLLSGSICHHHTTAGALHWLVKHGKYDLIKVIGVDGGTGYAPGSYFHQPTIDLLNQQVYERTGIKNHLLDNYKQVLLRLVEILENVYSCKITFYT